MPNVVNIESLQRAAQTYQKDFLLLPYALLIPVLQELKISMLEVNNKDIVIVKERAGGAAKPYVAGAPNYTAEISRLLERELQTYRAVAAIKDNITNYSTKQVLFDAAKNKVNNQTKQHPLERDIIADIITTVGEDIIDCLFHAKRDVADQTPQGMANGFYTLADSLIIAGEISEAKGNLVPCGTLLAPNPLSTDTSSFTNLRDWLRNVDQKWRQKDAVLYIPYNSLINVKDALENKKTSFKDVTFDSLLTQLREDCGIPKLQLVAHYCLGIGDRLMLTQPGNLDLGMNTMSDTGFVQVRNPYEDANEVQFWNQFEIGMRIKNYNKRGFMISDGAVTANELSGDYSSGSGNGVGV